MKTKIFVNMFAKVGYWDIYFTGQNEVKLLMLEKTKYIGEYLFDFMRNFKEKYGKDFSIVYYLDMEEVEYDSLEKMYDYMKKFD